RERAFEKRLEEEARAAAEEAELPAIGGHRLRWLTPANAKIHLGTFDTLHASVINERSYGGVYAVRCMPVRHERRYISLRHADAEGHEREVGLIRDLD